MHKPYKHERLQPILETKSFDCTCHQSPHQLSGCSHFYYLTVNMRKLHATLQIAFHIWYLIFPCRQPMSSSRTYTCNIPPQVIVLSFVHSCTIVLVVCMLQSMSGVYVICVLKRSFSVDRISCIMELHNYLSTQLEY